MDEHVHKAVLCVCICVYVCQCQYVILKMRTAFIQIVIEIFIYLSQFSLFS